MWQRMSESEGGGGLSVDFLSTHPANAKRIKVSSSRQVIWAMLMVA
jgi:predicted Zn-dependent protease